MERRSFLQLMAYAATATSLDGISLHAQSSESHGPAARIVNEYSAFLPGEREALAEAPLVSEVDRLGVRIGRGGKDRHVAVGGSIESWHLLTTAQMNGVWTAVFEKHVTHRGAIVFVTADRGTIAHVPKGVGDLARIRPRQVAAPDAVQLKRPAQYIPGPDISGNYILAASGDPSYETVAALGPEFIGWTLVANEIDGPQRSLMLEPDGTSREWNNQSGQAAWAPDTEGPLFDPKSFFPNDNAHQWKYEKGFSKRTLLGGYTPIADTGVWNAQYNCGYETMVLLPETPDARFMARVRIMVPDPEIAPGTQVYRDEKNRAFIERYVNCNAASFFSAVAGVWNRWRVFFESSMAVRIPDEWLLESARAGIMLARCSCRGLEPTYQIGEGAYTKIPERSHALFPVAEYEFVWAHQLWNLTEASDPYFQFYLDHYVLPNGDFTYNTQDQVEAPINTGFFLRNAARGFFYTRNLEGFRKSMPTLLRMAGYVEQRHQQSLRSYPAGDSRHGLIWGSPEADLGDPANDFPASHPFYYQNTAGVWRGFHEYALALAAAAETDPTFAYQAEYFTKTAASMRSALEQSLKLTLAALSPSMKKAGISPFTPEDTERDPKTLLSYENHRFMQDWFLADWGDESLDVGHLRHRSLAGMEVAGLHIDGVEQRTSNFMEHGTLAVKIRQKDYRSFLLTLYSLVCFAADSGNRYSPEDALIPAGYAGEGLKYWWSAVVNSVLQPTLGLRWLLCYEESDAAVCHLQKAAPEQWFQRGQTISVQSCPTRFGSISWSTTALEQRRWQIVLTQLPVRTCVLRIHIHPGSGQALRHTSAGTLEESCVRLEGPDFLGKNSLMLEVS